MATTKQVALIQRLGTERGLAEPFVGLEELDTRAASAMIAQLLAMPRPVVAGQPETVTEPGMYRTADGSIYKVQAARETGHLYAKKLVQFGGTRLTEVGERVHFEFQYDRGALRALKASDRMTLEQAKAFGIQYGVCCVCGAWLRDADSVAAGIGPVCATKV